MSCLGTSEDHGVFVQRQVSAVVMACNTMSAVVMPRIKEPPVPLINIIDAAVTQALTVTKGRIGVLATRATTESRAYPRAFHGVDPSVEVVVQACPKLVPFIEAGYRTGSIIEQAVKEYVVPLLEAEVDTIILGCTHYPFVLPEIRRIVGPHMPILDPAQQIRVVVRTSFREKESASPGSANRSFGSAVIRGSSGTWLGPLRDWISPLCRGIVHLEKGCNGRTASP